MEKNTGKVREFCQPGKVGTMQVYVRILSIGGGGLHPQGRHPPPDGHCSGRYTSYWNAFLFQKNFEGHKSFCVATDTPILDFW